MNISLSNGSGQHPSEPDDCNLQGDIEEHRQILEGAGYNLTGNTALLNEGTDYPGSYQVWSETTQDTWVYIDTEGNAIETECPISNPTGEEWKR